MEVEEVRNLLRSEGEQFNEVPTPTIDVNERQLEDIVDLIQSEGLDHLIHNVGTISNVFKTEGDFTCSPEVKTEAISLIFHALERLEMGLVEAQGDTKKSLTNVDKATRHKFRKYMSVLFFLIHKSFDDMERAVTAESHNISVQLTKDAKKRKKRADNEDIQSPIDFWFGWRKRVVEQLWKVIVPPMDEVWENNPTTDGYNIMRCLTLALCASIKNKSKQLRNNLDDELETMFNILGVLASRHGEESGIITRLIPLLKGSEETAKIIANGINQMLQFCPDKAQNIVVQVLTETLTVYTSRFDKETGQERGFHAFLTQLCSLQQKGALCSLPVILQFLDAESHVVRNAVLIIAQELMNWTWSVMETEDAEDDGRKEERKEAHMRSRQNLLNDILLKYMQDVNSHVRSKAISLIAEIVKDKAIYPPEAVKILRHVKLRLLDKTVTTRKAATSLVVDLVAFYPHIVCPLDEFEKKREDILKEICDTIRRDEENTALALFFIIKEFFIHVEMYGFMPTPSMKEKTAKADVALENLMELLKKERYFEACELMYLCVQTFSAQLEPLLVALKTDDNDPIEALYLRFFKSIYEGVFPQAISEVDVDEANYTAPISVKNKRDFLIYTQNLFKMQLQLEKCQPSLRKLLELGTTTDKKEAVMFFATICEAGYVPPHGITVSIINALAQLNDEELPDFVDPFKKIFIGRENYGNVGFARKLIELVHILSESEVESLSGMVRQLYRSHMVTMESVNVLWDAFSLSAAGNWKPEDSRSAGYVLGIIGQIDRNVITTNLKQLIDVGLGPRGLDDFELAKVTLQAILFGCRIEHPTKEIEVPTVKGRGKTAATVRPNKTSECQKFSPNHQLFPKIVELVETGLKIEGNFHLNIMYPKVVELSMQIIYRMCTHPSEVVSKFLPNIHGHLFTSSGQATPADTQIFSLQSQPESQSQQQSQPIDTFKLSEILLFRYMSFGKALLGAHIMYYEQIVATEIKLRKQAIDKANKKKSKTGIRPRASRMSAGNSGNSSVNSSTAFNQSNDAAAAEMDVMIGNIGFDAEADSIKSYVAKLLDSGFFRQFRVHVFFLAQKFCEIKSLNLKVAVVQALTKLMLVCETSVVKSIDVLTNLWNGDEHFAVKLEILKNSIRLTVKFPNQMEKMNDCFSAGLAHAEIKVRKACMDYIQYLALSDLLKVREQLSDTAACLCDENFELREMARDFINQISEKDNVLQNSIPDIISRLSARDDISQENFQNIMKTLLTKIRKEKQLGGLIERIVGRFKGIVSVRVCQDTAFCLTQIQQNDKTFKILKDSINYYCDKLADPFVWEFFQEIVATFKKLNKADLKPKIEEWEKDLEDHHNKCVALHNAEQAAKKKHEKPQRRRMVQESSSEDEAEENRQEGQQGENKENEGGEEEAMSISSNNSEEGGGENDVQSHENMDQSNENQSDSEEQEGSDVDDESED